MASSFASSALRRAISAGSAYGPTSPVSAGAAVAVRSVMSAASLARRSCPLSRAGSRTCRNARKAALFSCRYAAMRGARRKLGSLIRRTGQIANPSPRTPSMARFEHRRRLVCHDVAWLVSDRRYFGGVRLPSLADSGMVEATATRAGKACPVRRFCLSSARLGAPTFAAAARAPIHRGSRLAKPCHPVNTRRQCAASRQTRDLHPTQAESLRIVERLRQIRPRPNAIALGSRY